MNCRVYDGGFVFYNASMAAQIAGALLGVDSIPPELISRLKTVDNYARMQAIIGKTKN